MSNSGIEFEKLDDFEKRMLDLAKKKYPNECKKFIRKLARKVVKVAKQNTKVGPTGNLKKGWRVGKLYQRDNNFWIVVKNIAPHAHLVEKGHDVTRKKKKLGGEVLGRAEGRYILEHALKVTDREMPYELKNWIAKMIQEEGL